ncbi:MAG: transglutaminase domain-containing protein [Chloroflexi bacterium]|nr:transglutaminase domain-containing protein [Chloroflexota bacterium]
MAELEWMRPVARPASPAAPAWLRGLARRFFDWEDWLTLALALAAVLAVSLSLEGAGWSQDMPALSLVGVLALLLSLFVARSSLPALLAWPLALVMGAVVTFWQTLEMVGPGGLETRVDAIYVRFNGWFYAAFTNQISNDPLPRDVLTIGLTWLGVFLFGWSLFRWHNAWPGLVPGGVALFMDLVIVGDSLSAAIVLYLLLGALLVMRTNLTARIRQWRAEGVSYPPFISISILHYALWAVLFLIAAAWIAPVGPFPTPKVVEALVQPLEGIGTDFVRLAGPLRVKKIVPVHNYTSILPFQGSVRLGERELLSVRVDDPTLEGPIALRGAVYDEYGSGGWSAGPRREIELSPLLAEQVRQKLQDGSLAGRLVALTVQVEAKSVVGTVLFSPGEPVSAGVPARIEALAGSVFSAPIYVPGGGAGLSDQEVLAQWAHLPPRFLAVGIERDGSGRVLSAQVIDGRSLALLDALVVRPQDALAEGESYVVFGLTQTVSDDELRQGGWDYPAWIRDQYLQLPDNLPERVTELAGEVALTEATPYDRAQAIEAYLRQYKVDYSVADTPPGRDTVDYFLFDSKRGYFDYHASAMVVMLRAIGVPARLAVGFVIDQKDYDRDSGAYMVRDRNAYAWPEVYIPGHGWVEFNPSPDRPEELRPGTQAEAGTLTEPDLDDFPDLPVGSGAFLPIVGGDTASGSSSSSDGSGFGYEPWIALAVAGLAAAVAGSVALGWRRSVAGLPYPQQLWEKTVRLASWAGHPPEPGQTPADFAGRLERAFRGVRDIPTLAAAYNRSRFAHRDAEAAERQHLAKLWPHLRGALLWAMLARLWRRR